MDEDIEVIPRAPHRTVEGVDIEWVEIAAAGKLPARTFTSQALAIVHRGSGEVSGDVRTDIATGETIVLAAGQEHGLVAGPEGFAGFIIRSAENAEDSEAALQDLLEYNRERLAEVVRGPLFELLSDGTLDDPVKRAAYLDYLKIWVNGNQTLLLTRQVSCVDPKFERVFFEHMQDEIGHDMMYANREGETKERPAPPPRDALMEAITDWFVHQMMVLDNAEKAAVIHLVIESASLAYHERAQPVLTKYVNAEYFDVHVDNDADHAALGPKLLRDVPVRSYPRLREVLGQAWDVIGAMSERLTELTRAAR